MRQLTIVLSLVLLSCALAGCGKSQEEKEAEAHANYIKAREAYQESMRQTNARFEHPAKDKHDK
jgi:uncharacterized lipoprotein YehR (DUF1307 family)